MQIREIRRDEVPHATDLFLESCRLLTERDAEWAFPTGVRSTGGSFALPSPTMRCASSPMKRARSPVS